jgi:hypothetical protein
VLAVNYHSPSPPRVEEPQTFGSVKSGSFWVDYPSGLVDLTCSNPLESGGMLVNPLKSPWDSSTSGWKETG